MNKIITEKPLEEVRKWKREFSEKLAKMSHDEIIEKFGKTGDKPKKYSAVSGKK